MIAPILDCTYIYFKWDFHLIRRKRLLSLSAQKFISDLSRDAYHFAKLRVNGTAAGRGRPAAQDRNKVVLTMDDLSLALSEHGVNAKKPDYCAYTG